MRARLTLALLLLAAPASAGSDVQANTAIRIYCSDADGSRHPKKIELVQLLSESDVAALEGGRLLVGYDRDGDADSKGVISVTGRLQRARGGSEKLGKITATLNRVTGETVGAREVDFDAEPGDRILWTFKFRKLGALDAGQCGTLVAGVTRPSEGCGPYPASASSPYILPFRAGQASVMSQGNCSGIGSHRWAARHAYDFALPIGTEILAIASGVVEALEDISPDGTGLPDDDNYILVRNDDGTYANYVHIAQGSALVDAGERIERGQPIAASGNSGSTSGVPHLHLQLTSCPFRSVCGTLPFTFRNTSRHPNGLQAGKLYRAR